MFYTYPLLGIIFAPLTVFYYITAVFYRRTSVEVKRLDSLMRSTLYGSYSGMQTICMSMLPLTDENHAYRDFDRSQHRAGLSRTSQLILCYVAPVLTLFQTRFVKTADHGLDLENRAYYITIAIQRWLSVRLDFLGNLLILGIALFSAGFRKSVNPSKTGVVLSYTLSSTYHSFVRT